MSIKRANVLLLTDDMIPGGVERHVVHLANGLDKKGVGVYVAATDGPFRKLLSHSIPFLSLSILSNTSLKKSPLGFLRSILMLNKFVRDNNISIVHSHKRYTDFIGRLVVVLSQNIVHVSTCHNVFKTMSWFPSFGEYTIACSRKVEQVLIHKYGKPPHSVQTIYNGVPELPQYSDERKSLIRKRFGIPENAKIISSIGSLTKRKNPEIILQAFRRVQEQYGDMNIRLLLMGEGDQKNILEKQIVDYELRERVHILDADCAVEDVMNISSFCILASIREGFPLVLLEAASIGKPYISTGVGGVAEFIEHGNNGILIPPNNFSALEAAISYLLLNPKIVQLLGDNARMKYQQYFSAERMVDETIKVYERLLEMRETKK